MKKLTIQKLPIMPFDTEEAINQLRVNLGFCGNQIKTVMITSSVPSEGKSFIAINLWRMLAEVGMRTLLIDCDLRKSEMRTRYEIGSDGKMTGIAHYLAGKVELEDAIYETNIPNGFMIPLSASVANPTILLENPRFDEMLKDCSQQFDYVLVDTPPVESVADALRITSHVDGTVMVIRNGKTSRKVVKDAVAKLSRSGTPLLGVVLNRVKVNRNGNYYYKHYYYGGYGKGYHHQAAKTVSTIEDS